MPKLRKRMFYTHRHRDRLVKNTIREVIQAFDHDEVDYLTESGSAQSDTDIYRQLQQNSDSSFEHEGNVSYQLIQQKATVENEEIEEGEEVNINVIEGGIPSDDYDSEDSVESEDENNGIDIVRLRQNLVQWSHNNDICISAITNLLRVLRKEEIMNCLPADGRTLLRTPRTANTIVMEHGRYCYFEIEKGLRHTIEISGTRRVPEEIHLSINVDGLPLVKSSKSQLWTILASFRNFVNKTPFLVGAFHGYEKPPAAGVFLYDFVEETEKLMQNGFNWKGNNIKFFIDCFICDAPARAYISCTKGHTGYYGCPKCETKGIYRGKIVFPEMNSPLRTAESFINQTQKQHHTGVSPLLDIVTDMVLDMPHDYMHLVLLGQTKKMLKIMTGKLSAMKLGTQQISDISKRQVALRKHIPFDFARKPRALDELDRMKATEYREFLLYTGPIVLRKIVRQDVYEHFLKLSVAIRILAMHGINVDQNRYAKSLLEAYFIDFIKLYGENNVTYNTHGLLHLADDALKWGALDEFSAFIFENQLQQIKKMVRKNDKPLEQLSNRIFEIRSIQSNIITIDNTINTYKLGAECYNGCLINECRGPMYKKIEFKHFIITTKAPNNYCIMTDESIVLVKSICHRNNGIVVIGKILKNGTPFFTSPAPSTCFGIVQFSGTYSSLRVFSIDDIKNKAVVLPVFDECYRYEDRHNNIVVFPLIHNQ
ncbi:uncharacterized protein LOC105829709 [Monomorium pharaonis]|uniref:uncharacterized protein LOC105829709 n=1 Tax=Monomorium pharaonis TaxID=307658 RepID=UPI00174631FE|nr:uncharacterized protein LOC105829709 [Monomorium pharaonis]XP_012524205.2 uncharacterized protein LOC105829709 [Monomorium pharaonis]